MTAWLEALNDAWNDLERIPPVAREYRSRLISSNVPLDVLAGLRAADGALCLMLQTSPPQDALFELGGMRLHTVPDTDGTYLVLSLEDPSRRDLFGTLCADIVAAAALANRQDALSRFLTRLDAWRQFLRDRRAGLSRSETIGLIGELLVLEQLIITDSRRLTSWEAPNDGLHDFVDRGHALEIKTSLGPASSITISKLDQLDISGLRRLDLLHVRLIEFPSGLSLREIAAAVSDRLPDETTRRGFENTLLRRGLTPDDDVAHNTPRVQLRSIDAYAVTDNFPRLSRSSLPIAIVEATYTLEVRALAAFAADIAAVLDAFNQGDHT